MAGKPLCLCSPCERARFRAWERRCNTLGALVEVGPAGGLATVLSNECVRRRSRLCRDVLHRLSGAHPEGMTSQIVCALAAIYRCDFEEAATEFAELAEDETVSMRLNPSERYCPQEAAAPRQEPPHAR